jgi:GNAT superfamily N-acetyltransferase
MATELTIRRATVADREAIVGLAARSLHWAGDERDRGFFAWKHDENAFGPSPAWVADVDGRIVGFRTLMRWELERGGERLQVVRAVDTATDPDFQGAGIFTRLTLGAVDELTADGFDAVFNTPNDQSRPGYLKMGWSQLGRPTIAARPRGPLAAVRMLGSRAPAEKWSEPVTVGVPALDLLRDIEPLLREIPSSRGWSTSRSGAYLRWRYGFAPLNYRAIEVRGGVAVFRVRRRGPNREVAVCEWLAPGPDRRAVGRLVRRSGDYAMALGLGPRDGFVPLPKRGPIVTWRPLARAAVPALEDLAFGLGDLELF